MSVARANLCVTEGAIEELPGERLSVSVSKMRAYVNAFTPQLVEGRFTYLGPTENEARLGSGELRRQFGLKLRAQDACNLVYAMWRIEPESKLVVSVKNNPGQTGFRPPLDLALESHFQYSRKPARCQPTTVLGVTWMRGSFHRTQHFRNTTQNSLCAAVSRRRGRWA